jgi:hypothetical protein
MFKLFRAIIERIKLMFATAAAQELEADFVAANAERKAALLRESNRYESEGLPTVAAELRQRAEALDPSRPLTSVLPLVEFPGKEERATTQPPGILGHNKATVDNGASSHLPEPSSGSMTKRRSGRKST